MKKSLLVLMTLLLCVCTLSARRPKKESTANGPVATASAPELTGQTMPGLVRPIGGELPKAQIYKMSGDWSQYVPVTFNAEGTELVSFPAPSDITNNSIPVSVGDGWWLDRRGVSQNTVFTRWTYADYAKLDHTPTPEEIMNNLIPGSKVITVLTLPMTESEAAADPAAVRRLVADGLRDAVVVYRLPGY